MRGVHAVGGNHAAHIMIEKIQQSKKRFPLGADLPREAAVLQYEYLLMKFLSYTRF